MPSRKQILSLFWYLAPCALLVIVHRHALKSWFLQDDFAWLALRLEIIKPRDLLTALFQPRAQGTVRVLSERAFFIIFSKLFGMNAVPFHVFTFLTMGANLILLQWITCKLTASRMAGVLAAFLWAVSANIAIPLAWLSSYNQILCAFFALTAFFFLLRFVETGRNRDWILQWAFYLCGFLALESMVVYPAIACLYLWIFHRDCFKRALWLWIPAIAFAFSHLFLIPKTAGPKYQMVFDLGILRNLGLYVYKGIGPSDMAILGDDPWTWLGPAIATAVAISLLAFCLIRFRHRDWTPLIPLAWFVCFIAPILPLQNHVSEYYLALPSAGFAMLGGWAIASAWNANWPFTTIAVVLTVALAWGEIAQAQLSEFWFRSHGLRMRGFLNGASEVFHHRDGGALIIAGVDDTLIEGGIEDNPFRLYGIDNAYLAPGTETLVRNVPKDKIPYLVDQGGADSLLASPRTLVVSVSGDKVADVTETYRAMRAGHERITLVRPGDPAVAAHLGKGWYQSEPAFRWMAGKATLHLDVPADPKLAILVSAYSPLVLLENTKNQLELTVTIGNLTLGTRRIAEGSDVYRFEIPAGSLGDAKSIEVTLATNKTLHYEDGRDLGLAISEVALVSH